MKEPASGKGSKQNSGTKTSGKSGGTNGGGAGAPPAKREGRAVGSSPTFDAIFFTRAAIEKFVVPFYNNRHEGDGDRVSKTYAARSNEIYAVGHMPECGLVFLVMEDVAIAGAGRE